MGAPCFRGRSARPACRDQSMASTVSEALVVQPEERGWPFGHLALWLLALRRALAVEWRLQQRVGATCNPSGFWIASPIGFCPLTSNLYQLLSGQVAQK